MELISGGDLYSTLCEKKRLHPDIAKGYFINLIDALKYCHQRKVFHRDIKLENLLLTPDGALKLCDFGLASIRGFNGEDALLKTVCGTEDFTPPEMILHQPYDGEKTDCWSAGIILYTMIAGYTPFRGETSRQIYESIIRGKLVFPDRFPAGAADLVRQLLKPDPRDRITSLEVVKHSWVASEYQVAKQSEKDVRKTSDSESWTSSIHVPECDSETSPRTVNQQQSFSPMKNNDFIQKASSGSTELEVTDGELAVASDSGNTSNLGFYYACKTIQNFSTIYESMRKPAGGIKVEDRKWRFKTYPKCFIGTEAVTWISKYSGVSRKEAVRIGQEFLDAEVFHHVCRDHTFKDDYLFYRFQEDEDGNRHILNIRQKWKQLSNGRNSVIVSYNLLKTLLELCGDHQVPGDEKSHTDSDY